MTDIERSQVALSIKMRYAVFCDDIRREDNGKLLFVGVYTQGIMLPSFPADLNFSVYYNGEFEGVGDIGFEAQVLFQPGDLQVLHMGARARRSKPDTLRPRFELAVGSNFQVQRDGHFSVQFRTGDFPWQEVDRISVNRMQHPAGA